MMIRTETRGGDWPRCRHIMLLCAFDGVKPFDPKEPDTPHPEDRVVETFQTKLVSGRWKLRCDKNHSKAECTIGCPNFKLWGDIIWLGGKERWKIALHRFKTIPTSPTNEETIDSLWGRLKEFDDSYYSDLNNFTKKEIFTRRRS